MNLVGMKHTSGTILKLNMMDLDKLKAELKSSGAQEIGVSLDDIANL